MKKACIAASMVVSAATVAQGEPLELAIPDLDRVVTGQSHGGGGCGGGGGGGGGGCEGTLPSLGFGNSGYGGHVGFFNRGRQDVGVLNEGRQNVGVLNQGRENLGLGNQGETNIGFGNKGTGNLGVGLTGEGWIGIGPIKLARRPRS